MDVNIKNLTKFVKWKADWNKDNSTLWDYAEFSGNIELGIAFSKIFYPDLIEHDNLIFIKQNFTAQSYNDWRNNLGYGKESDIQMQLVFNHLQIYDLFLNDQSEIELYN